MSEGLTTATTSPDRWAQKFFIIWSGQAISLIGSALVQFALVWWLTQKTGSATILATVSLVALLPQILLGPFVGALVDRWNRRVIMIAADTVIALATAGLMILFATNRIEVWHIYVISLIRSLGGAFHHPAMTSSTSLMVPNKHLGRVAGANQLLQGLVNIFAPPLGALLISIMPTQSVLGIDVVTAILAVVPLLFLPIPMPPRQLAEASGMSSKTTYWQDLGAGLSYVAKWPGLIGIILLAMALNFLLSPSSSLLPLLIIKGFGKGAQELAWVESTFGIGIILGGILLSAWGGFKRRIITSLMGIIGIGFSVILTGATPAGMLYILLVSGFFLGFSQVIANGPLQAVLQSTVIPDMQGRVFSLIGAGAAAMVPLSLLIAGPVADLVGVRFWYIIGGSICIIMVIAALFIPAIINFEQNHHQELAKTE